MDKTTNQELFKQALVEGVNRRIDRELAACEEEVVFSRKHIKAMTRIIYGNTPAKPINKKMIAILVAAAILLLAGCTIINCDKIRGFITDFREFFITVTFSGGESESRIIDEVYELTYVPEGYICDNQYINLNLAQYIFKNPEGNIIKFTQHPLDNSSCIFDAEHGDHNIIEIGQYEIYHRCTISTHCYIWNDGKYALKLNATNELSPEELELIIIGIKAK